MTPIAYRGEGHTMQPGCTLQAHYDQVQALCDALGYAAQQLQAEWVEKTQSADMSTDGGMMLGWLAARQSSYWYGVFQGYRGLLRALEGNTGELEAIEQQALARIDWNAEKPHFVVPGFEGMNLAEQHLPGEGPDAA